MYLGIFDNYRLIESKRFYKFCKHTNYAAENIRGIINFIAFIAVFGIIRQTRKNTTDMQNTSSIPEKSGNSLSMLYVISIVRIGFLFACGIIRRCIVG